MAYEFKFPDIGEGLTEGEIVEWKVKVGDKVADHQTFLEVETDKAVAEVPSPAAGYVLSLKGGPGDVIKVGEVIAVIGTEEELKAKKTAPAPPREEKAAVLPPEKKLEKKVVEPQPKYQVKMGSVGVVGELEEAPEDEEEAPKPKEVPAAAATGRVDALPKDRTLARQLGVDIEQVHGTGPKGRVTEDDIKKHAEQGVPQKGIHEPSGAPGADTYGPVERVPLRGVRRKIALAMVESMTKTAQVTSTDEADVDLLWHIREKEKAGANEQGVHLTLLPFLVKAVVGALKRDPAMNSSLDDEKGEIIYKSYYNIGIAVETEDGLIVPNVKDADKKSIMQIAKEIDELSHKARKRTLDIKDLKGGTFTITNYGSIGGIFGTPIVNYPEVGILGVGRMMEKPVVEDGAIKIKKILPLSLTFDHRVVDGAKAQHFMNNLKMHIEDPDLIFVGI